MWISRHTLQMPVPLQPFETCGKSKFSIYILAEIVSSSFFVWSSCEDVVA